MKRLGQILAGLTVPVALTVTAGEFRDVTAQLFDGKVSPAR